MTRSLDGPNRRGSARWAGTVAACALGLAACSDPTAPIEDPPAGTLIFASQVGSRSHVFAMNTDGTGRTQLTSSPDGGFTPAVTRDGSRIAFVSSQSGASDIWIQDVAGGDPVQLTSAAGQNSSPAWSPDGSRLAFVSTRDGNEEIYVVGADGSQLVRLTFDPGADLYPSWSPDGSRIAFASTRPANQSFEVWAMDADGGQPVQLTSMVPAGPGRAASASSPAWSPDGERIAFVGYDGVAWGIWFVGADGSGLGRVTRDGELSPAWSPDGEWIVCVRANATTSQDLWVMRADGTSAQNLTNTVGESELYPSWRD